MSGRELDRDGTDSFHPEHPWEQSGHPKYLTPARRSKQNWPPAPAFPTGVAEALAWASLPELTPQLKGDWFRQYVGSSVRKSEDLRSEK